MNNLYKSSILVLVFGLYFFVSSVHAEINDPYQSYNRSVENINKNVDQYVLKPTTESYVAVVPDPARIAVSNVVNNLLEPITVINDILQGKITQGIQDTARFIFNSTFGLFGLIDISTPMGLPMHDEDFGQTFAVWGWSESDYFNLPLLGPATVRDATAKPISLILTNYGIPFTVLRVLSLREKLMPLDPLLETASDRYLFIRDGYLQQRNYQINDGKSSTTNKFKEFDFSD